MTNRRPNPKDLLKAVQKLERGENRGRLRVFLGMCPGVGKTYSMLRAAQDQSGRGTKVLLGVVETHGRIETEKLTQGLEAIPKIELQYRESKLFEMDLDEVLKRAPDLVIVDELAHTNAPGSRHTKRYQDVEEILSAGIDVYTTLNVQHIESRNDQVAQVTGVAVKETVPDSFLEKADQIEMIDISPPELLQRLSDGKVYLGDRAERAAEGFFKEESLTALRELALRFTAEKVDQDLLGQMTVKGIEGPWNINERLLVAISHSPYSSRLIRATRRMAYNLEAPWIALHVENDEVLSAEDQEMLQKNLDLARRLGADVIAIADNDLAGAIGRTCIDKNVTQIVMGRPDKRFFRDIFSKGTLLDQLVSTTSKIDIHVIRADRRPKYRGFHLRFPRFTTEWLAYYNTGWFIAATSFLCYALLPYVGYRALGSVFLIMILIVATLSTRGPIFFAALSSALIWDYFFIPPHFTFVIRSYEDFMMLFLYLLTAVVGGFLTKRIRNQETVLQVREARARSLYELGRKLSEAKDIRKLNLICTSVLETQFGGEAVIVLRGADGKLVRDASSSKLDDQDFAVAVWVFENKKTAGWSAQTLAGSKCLCFPMKGNSDLVGVLVFYPGPKQKNLTLDQDSFFETVINQVSIAIERLQFSEAAESAKLFEASEKLHQTLINSVSHELRTPITTIIGTSTALKDPATCRDNAAREALTDELVKSAQRLDRVVENLLDISRLEKGTLRLKKEWFEVRDLIDSVKSDLKEELGKRHVKVEGDLSALVEGDFKLLHHALLNLVLNAIRYSDGAIELEVESSERGIKILVKDFGKGLPQGKEHLLFEKFYRLPETPSGGIGLGLSIVKSIVELHGGNVIARDRTDASGAQFEIILPVRATPAELKEIIK